MNNGYYKINNSWSILGRLCGRDHGEFAQARSLGFGEIYGPREDVGGLAIFRGQRRRVQEVLQQGRQ